MMPPAFSCLSQGVQRGFISPVHVGDVILPGGDEVFQDEPPDRQGMAVAATDTSTSVSAFAFADLNRVLYHSLCRVFPVSIGTPGTRNYTMSRVLANRLA